MGIANSLPWYRWPTRIHRSSWWIPMKHGGFSTSQPVNVYKRVTSTTWSSDSHGDMVGWPFNRNPKWRCCFTIQSFSTTYSELSKVMVPKCPQSSMFNVLFSDEHHPAPATGGTRGTPGASKRGKVSVLALISCKEQFAKRTLRRWLMPCVRVFSPLWAWKNDQHDLKSSKIHII